ncbi:alpha-amylase family glycosyl hydrolase [Gracilibacillus alcaliphilus]|uniref:alpha-amylase family glycosyl hydrolase n=1 Tax=Gracilibacillus alcaliphilus TaxID=1401441 RepID=UPI001956CEBA|nr:alpha-amylase family glycosyl hydrolase [Gracilibacillus alcaliphilus]
MYYMKKGIIAFCSLFLLLPFLSAEATEQNDEKMYYILVDRFNNGDSSNDIDINIEDPQAYHGGDLQGIIKKLDHFQDMGITVINLSPVMEAGSYHGFDVVEPQNVNPHFGDVAVLQQLVSEAHEKDIKVILDFVLTHVSEEHPWNNGQINWVGAATENQLGESLPTVDMENQDVQEYFLETAVFWMQTTNIDGFHFYINEQTPDDFISNMNQRLQTEKEDLIILYDGEHATNDNDMNTSFQTEAVDILKQPGQSITPLLERDITGIHYMEGVTTPRFAYASSQAGFNPLTRWKLATTLLYTLPGTSMLYQGVEVPMDNGVAEPDHRMAELNKEDEELMEHIDRLSNFAQDSSAMQHGDFEIVGETDAMTVFRRSSEDQTMYVAINNDTETKSISLSGIADDMQLRGLLEDDIVRQQSDGEYRIIMDRETSNIFILEDNSGINWFFISLIVVIFGGFAGFIVAVNRRYKKSQAENGKS